jgi:transcriptional regulator with XRE-family HTH domain
VHKAIHSAQQAHLQELLRRVRKEAGLTQVELGQRLDEPQSLISDYERGERRLDLIELKQVCDAAGIDLVEFVQQFVKAISAG